MKMARKQPLDDDETPEILIPKQYGTESQLK